MSFDENLTRFIPKGAIKKKTVVPETAKRRGEETQDIFLEKMKCQNRRGRCNQRGLAMGLGSYHKELAKMTVLAVVRFDLLCWTSMAIFHATFVMSSTTNASLKRPLQIRGCFAIVHTVSTMFH